MDRKLVAENVTITVGAEERTIDIYVNKYGSLELVGIGDVMYDMLGEELSFGTMETEPRSNI